MAEFFGQFFCQCRCHGNRWSTTFQLVSLTFSPKFRRLATLIDFYLFFKKSFMLITLWADLGKNSSPWQRYEPSVRTLSNTARRSIRNSICQFSRTTGQSVAMATASGFIFVKIVLNECSCSYVRMIRRSADFRLFLGGFTHAHAVHVRIVQSGRK
jgi:hypothetical protein